MESFITQCPQCKTAFRVSHAQLLIADGNVRCGACLNVFVAQENLLDAIEEEPPVRDAITDAEMPDPAGPEFTVEPEEEAGDEPDAADKSKTEPDQTSLWELLDEDDTERHAEFKLPPLQHALLESEVAADASVEEAEATLAALRASALEVRLVDDTRPQRFSAENRDALRVVSSPLELHPVELHPGRRARLDIRRMIAGGALALFLTLTLGLQWLWFNRETLATQTEWRPRIETLCTIMPCTVAPLQDLGAIVSDNLVVRSHPEVRGALLISMNFRNRAPFAQPFPGLTLRFTDTRQRAVGTRRFLPAEYLQDGLGSMALMPPNASIQARVEIVDPGSTAVNYEVFLGPLD